MLPAGVNVLSRGKILDHLNIGRQTRACEGAFEQIMA